MRYGFLLLALVALSGCKSALNWRATRSTAAIMAAQTPGTASGAGATVTGPANSAAPTTQIAERRTAYFPPAPRPAPVIVPVESPAATPAAAAAATPVQTVATVAVPPQPVGVTGMPAITPAWTYERSETTIGQHQDAAGIAKVAATVGTWGALKWCGLLCILGGIAGLLYAAGHGEGYPLVCWKVIGCGVFFMLVGDNALWLLLLLVPFGFYAAQKFGLIALPEASLLTGLKNLVVAATAPPSSAPPPVRSNAPASGAQPPAAI